MAIVGRSAKLYQERREPEHRNTRRGPGPRVELDQQEARHLKLEPPLPLPALLHDNNGTPPPDTTRTTVWPHGDEFI